MDETFPLFTVNIAVYNQLDNIKVILEALKRQSFKDFEISITDDGSSDGTKEYMENIKDVRYLWQEKKGFRLARSKNMGIKNAKGKYFLSIEGDVIPHQDLLRSYVPHLDEKTILLGVRHEIHRRPRIDELNDLSDQVFSLDFRLETLRKWKEETPEKPYMYASGCNLLLPTQALLNVGMWDEEYQGYGKDDYDVCMRMYKNGCKIKPVIGAYAYHIDHPHGHSQASDDRFFAKEKELGL